MKAPQALLPRAPSVWGHPTPAFLACALVAGCGTIEPSPTCVEVWGLDPFECADVIESCTDWPDCWYGVQGGGPRWPYNCADDVSDEQAFELVLDYCWR